MKRLTRAPLSEPTRAFLAKRTQQVSDDADPKQAVERLWKQQDNAAFEEVRSTLQGMTTGRQRCMYCEDNQATDIEHFWPKARYPERAFSWSNYLLACGHCNSNHKRDQFPLDGEAPLLLDPTSEEPREHLFLSVRTGKYVARKREGQESPKGRWSIKVFGLDRATLEQGRQDAWNALPALLLQYDDACQRADWRMALDTQRTLCRFPFASVFVWFIDLAASPEAARFIDARCLSVLDKYPDIKDWL